MRFSSGHNPHVTGQCLAASQTNLLSKNDAGSILCARLFGYFLGFGEISQKPFALMFFLHHFVQAGCPLPSLHFLVLRPSPLIIFKAHVPSRQFLACQFFAPAFLSKKMISVLLCRMSLALLPKLCLRLRETMACSSPLLCFT